MTRKLTGLILGAALSVGTAAWAQDTPPDIREKAHFPHSDIFLFDVSLNESPALSNGRNVTARSGYDNQPSFTPDSQSFLFARGDDYQTDIFEYDIKTQTIKQITGTPTNEFSPMASPDNRVISFVTGGPNAIQNIAKISRAAPNDMTYILPGKALREPVGYYSWNRESGHVLFWSRYGFNVTLTHTDKNLSHYVSGDAVPSTPHIIPGTSNFSFVHRQGNESVWIKELNPDTKAVRPLAPLKGTNANYGWTPGGDILIIEDAALYRWSEAKGAWDEIADLTDHGIESAARLSVSPDGLKIAIVGQAVE